MVQTTFTRQKRELAKAVVWMEKLRAQEVRTVQYGPDGEKLNEVRETYVEFPPEEVTAKVLEIVAVVVAQHAGRQNANSRNTGHFAWSDVTADLTVPQLRTLQQAHCVLSDLVNKLPRRNPKLIPNTSVDGRPAFAHQLEEHFETKSRWVPYEEDKTTRVRSYEEQYQVLKSKSQVVEIDFGLEMRQVEKLRELVVDLGTAIQVAIDEANSRGHQPDPTMERVIADIRRVLLAQLQPVLPGDATPAN
jgi:hypothetical protein